METCARTLHFALHGAMREWVLNLAGAKIDGEGIAALEILLRGFAVDHSVVESPNPAA